MKKSFKRIPALLLAIIFAIMMPLTAFSYTANPYSSKTVLAHSNSTANINVNTGNPNDELVLYEVVKAKLNTDANTLTYSFSDAFKTYQKSSGAIYASLTTDEYCELTEEELVDVIGDFAAYCQNNGVTPFDKATTDDSGSAVFKDVPLGQYIILGDGSSSGAKIYQSVTAKVIPFVGDDASGNSAYMMYEEYSVDMKTFTPTIDKSIVDKNITKENGKSTANVGDTVTFKVEVKVPQFPSGATNKTFYVTDHPTEGISIKSDSIVVTDKNGNVISDSDYKVTLNNDGTLYVDLDYDAIMSYSGHEWVNITYDAVLNEKAVVGTDGNTNTATLVYSNSPFSGSTYDPDSGDPRPDDPDNPQPGYGSSTDTEYLYTYGVVIYKYDDDTKAPLANAEFEIYANEAGEGDPIATITTNSDGYAAFIGLRAGTFYAIETKAPTGFKLDSTPHKFAVGADEATSAFTVTTIAKEYTTDIEKSLYKVQATDENGNLLWFNPNDMSTVTLNKDADPTYLPAYILSTSTVISTSGTVGYVKVEIPNIAGGNLPGTGSIGVVPFVVAGSVLMIGAAIILVTRKRMNGTQN